MNCVDNCPNDLNHATAITMIKSMLVRRAV